MKALENRASELRAEFDRSFALPATARSRELEDLLAIRVNGDPFVVRVRDLIGIVNRCKIVPLPASAPSLLGLAGVRGQILPVFELGCFLGYEPSAAPPEWLVLSGADETIALAFTALEGHQRLERSAIHRRSGSSAALEHLREVATLEQGTRGVIEIATIVEAIRSRLGERPPKRER